MKKLLIKLIEFYKKTISPWLEHLGVHCKYEPTCSEYTKQAIEKYGVVKRNPFRNKENFKMQSFFKRRV